jgi:hypothetical protein
MNQPSDKLRPAGSKTPFEKLASALNPEKEALKRDGNRFTAVELAAMRETWRTATLVDDREADYRVESDAIGKIGGLNM